MGQADAHGWTAPMLAAQNGDTATVQGLIKLRADPGMKDNNGETALDLAARMGHK